MLARIVFVAAAALSLAAPAQELPSDVSVVSEAQAQAIFADLAAHKEIPWGEPEGCWAKAQQISLWLEARGLIVGKVFVEGNIFYTAPGFDAFWTYHVAPVLLVQTAEGPQPFVFDLFMAREPRPYRAWLAQVTGDRRSKITSVYGTNRFVCDPGDREATAYKQEYIREMGVVFAQLRTQAANRHRPILFPLR